MTFDFRVEVKGDFILWSRAEILAGEKAITRGIAGGTAAVKQSWRGQVAQALGARLGNAVRSSVYPRSEPSARAAGLVYTKAPQIIGAHESGALIRANNGFWLAVPLPGAGRGPRGARIKPGEWEKRTGRRLRFVYRRGKTALLVDDGTTLRGARVPGPKGTYKAARGFRNRTVPIFALVPQVKLKKVLNLHQSAEQIAGTVPGRIIAAWGNR